MSLSSTVKVVIAGDTKGAVKALKSVQSESTKTGSMFAHMGKIAAVGVAAVATTAVAVGTMLVRAGDKLNESQDLLQNALKDTGQGADALKGSIAPLYKQMQKWGVTNTEVNDGLALLIRAGDKATTAVTDMSLAENVAKGRHISLAAAEQILVKVRTGHVSLLGRYGIAVKDATGKTISQTAAIKKLSAMYSGSANVAASSLAGKTAMLKATFENLTAHLGQKLIPILLAVATWLTNTVLPAFDTAVKWVEVNWPRLWAAIQPTIVKIRGYITGFVAFVQMLWKNFGATIIAFAKNAWGSIKTEIKGALTVIQGVFRLFADILTGKWGKLWGDVKRIFTGLWGIIRGSIGLAFSELKAAIGLIWDGIGNKIRSVFDGIVNFFKKAPGRVRDAAVGMFDGIKDAFKSAINWLIGAWNSIHFTLPTIKFHVPHIIGTSIGGDYKFGGETFRVPQIPTLHSGGVYDSGNGEGLALLRDGEGIFTPAQMRALGGSLRAAHGGKTIINLPAGIDPAGVVRAQRRHERRNGVAA